MEEQRQIAIEILEKFEDFLSEKNIEIPNKERDEYKKDGDTETAILFGTDYYLLEDEITDIIKNN